LNIVTAGSLGHDSNTNDGNINNVIASAAKQSILILAAGWIASSLRSSQ